MTLFPLFHIRYRLLDCVVLALPIHAFSCANGRFILAQGEKFGDKIREEGGDDLDIGEKEDV